MSEITPERYEKTITDLMLDLFKANCEVERLRGLCKSSERATIYLSMRQLIAEADRYVIPVDVRVGATTFKVGCKVGAVLRSIHVHAEARIAHGAPEQDIPEGGDGLGIWRDNL